MHPQAGIFALGTGEHCYLELDVRPGATPERLIGTLAALSGPESEIDGVNLVVGVRPELWAAIAPDDAPPDVHSFRPVSGAQFTMPASQHDAWAWIAGETRSAVFDATVAARGALGAAATVASEETGWVYRHHRDLTGFIDGTENPSPLEAPGVALRAEPPGEGASVLLVQRWCHQPAFARLAVGEQERVIGRTKADSIELGEDRMPADSHVSRNVIEEDGRELRIYRRNTAYGSPEDHGTHFVGFCAEQRTLQIMLERMAGIPDGVRDALTRYTTPLTGAYYVVPAATALARLIGLEGF